jgi:hypothetical protein
MLTIIASGLSIAGLTLLARKLSASVHDVLHLSEDLDPLRPQARSDFESEHHATIGSAHEDEPYVESIRRLSGVVAGSNSKVISTPAEAPVVSVCAEAQR